MAETDKLIELLQQQMEAQRKQTEALIAAFAGEKAKREPPLFPVPAAAIPSFVPFDTTVELWTNYHRTTSLSNQKGDHMDLEIRAG